MAEFRSVGRLEDFDEGEIRAYEVEGRRVAVTRTAEALYAFGDTCTHAGCSLAEDGEVEDGKVACLCHGSEFDLATGEVLQGPARDPVPSYRVRLVGEELQIEV